MKNSLSLRARLTAVILTPLVLVGLMVGAWAYRDAEVNAAQRFDRSLLSTALAISRDIAVTGGDALSRETRDLLRDTSGGPVFYHVYAPDGVFVTGYATPPVPPEAEAAGDASANYYDAVYLSEEVRALRLTQQATVDRVTGLYTFTVWQPTSVRAGFVRTRTTPVFAIIATLIGTLVVIVWFGVRRGLAPLTSLEGAIARRSIEDLSPIRRKIPQEISGIVARFNDLVGELSDAIQARDAFISDASHQLRNPIAGVVALTDSVANARDISTVRERVADLRLAVDDVSHLTKSLLTLERLKAGTFHQSADRFDAAALLRGVAQKITASLEGGEVAFDADLPDVPCMMRGDPVMVEQAVLNVLGNALLHGGPGLSRLTLKAFPDGAWLPIVVQDDGKGIGPEDFEKALGRFSQVGPSPGSGLGLPIAAAVMRNHQGSIELENDGQSFRVEMRLPLESSGGSAGSASTSAVSFERDLRRSSLP